MRIRFLLLVIGSILLGDKGSLGGSNDLAVVKPSFSLWFRDSEVRSRRWVNSSGQEMQFIASSVFRLKGQPDLMVAKYGDARKGITYCLDFYATYKASDGGENLLQLLSHDFNRGKVIQITSSSEIAGIKISIRRLFQSAESQKAAQEFYCYEYTANGLVQGIDDIWTTNTVKGGASTGHQ